MDSTQISVATHKDRNHPSYTVREWRCIDGELTCLRVYVPYERREEPKSLGGAKSQLWTLPLNGERNAG
jgi:hypothetical protein